MKFYVGVDGGGTKTAICAASADSLEILSEITTGASWREHGVDHVVNMIKNNKKQNFFTLAQQP